MDPPQYSERRVASGLHFVLLLVLTVACVLIGLWWAEPFEAVGLVVLGPTVMVMAAISGWVGSEIRIYADRVEIVEGRRRHRIEFKEIVGLGARNIRPNGRLGLPQAGNLGLKSGFLASLGAMVSLHNPAGDARAILIDMRRKIPIALGSRNPERIEQEIRSAMREAGLPDPPAATPYEIKGKPA